MNIVSSQPVWTNNGLQWLVMYRDYPDASNVKYRYVDKNPTDTSWINQTVDRSFSFESSLNFGNDSFSWVSPAKENPLQTTGKQKFDFPWWVFLVFGFILYQTTKNSGTEYESF